MTMLREIEGGRRRQYGETRSWFQSDWFDLFLWQRDGRVVRFQLCYDRQQHERALTWDHDWGYRHHGVDGGEENPRSNRSPLLVPDGLFPFQEVYARFAAESAQMEPSIRSAVLERLRGYCAVS